MCIFIRPVLLHMCPARVPYQYLPHMSGWCTVVLWLQPAYAKVVVSVNPNTSGHFTSMHGAASATSATSHKNVNLVDAAVCLVVVCMMWARSLLRGRDLLMQV